MKNLLIIDNGKTNKYYENGMMRERPPAWCPDDIYWGKYENLSRTSYFYVAYRDQVLLDGIKSCIIDKGNGIVEIWRSSDQDLSPYPNYKNDVSRDSICSMLWALKLTGEQALVDKVVKGYRKNAARKYNPNFMDLMWMHSSTSTDKFWKYFQVHLFIWLLLVPFMTLLNTYDLLTMQMQISVARNSWLKKTLCRLSRTQVESCNLLSRVLLYNFVDERYYHELDARTDFQFQRKYTRYYTERSEVRKLTDEEKEYNELDKYIVEEVQKILKQE